MKFDWKNYDEEKPKKDGFYFVKNGRIVNLCYYCKLIETFIMFEYDYVEIFCVNMIGNVQWAKMPRFSKSKLLNDGYIKVEGNYIERR